jgi:hemolysin III
VVAYLAMGWLALVAVRQLFAHLPATGPVLLFAGEFFYTLGVLFFAFDYKRLSSLWHVLVLAGSVCHVFAVLTSTLARG